MRVVAVESIRPTAHAQGPDFSAQRALGFLPDVTACMRLPPHADLVVDES